MGTVSFMSDREADKDNIGKNAQNEADAGGADNSRCPLEGMGKMVFNKDSLEVIRRAAGDPSPKRYEMPSDIRERLDEINRQARLQESMEDEGGSRFYDKASRILNRSLKKSRETSLRLKRNFKIFLVVVLSFAGYYLYGEYLKKDVDSIEALQQTVPLRLDENTVLTAVENLTSEVILRITKDADYDAAVSPEEREAELNRIADNAQQLCKNSLLGQIVRNGRNLTVILAAEDGSYERRIEIRQCDL